jgi:Fe-S oxidoreductase
VIELMALLAKGLNSGRLSLMRSERSLTYHDPTLTPLLGNRATLARRVLAALTTQPVREMFWREGRAAPGGAVGGLEFTHPALAERMTRDRLAEAASTGANLLVTEDPAALAHFAAHANEAAIRIEGLYELVGQQLS